MASLYLWRAADLAKTTKAVKAPLPVAPAAVIPAKAATAQARPKRARAKSS
jgi:hypothetical protein